jgi:hypothetical protein
MKAHVFNQNSAKEKRKKKKGAIHQFILLWLSLCCELFAWSVSRCHIVSEMVLRAFHGLGVARCLPFQFQNDEEEERTTGRVDPLSSSLSLLLQSLRSTSLISITMPYQRIPMT